MSVLRKLYTKLHLQVNEAKSAVASVFGRKFLGFGLWVAAKGVVKRGVAAKPMATFKQRIRQLTRRSGGRSMALLRHQRRELAATRCATLAGAPKARSSRKMVVPRFHYLS